MTILTEDVVVEIEDHQVTIEETVVDDLIITEQGPVGPVGPRGPDGWSAYQLAVQQGFVGSLSSWLASLKGDPGQIQSVAGKTDADITLVAADISDSGGFGRQALQTTTLALFKTLLSLVAADIGDSGTKGRELLQATTDAVAKAALNLVKADVGLGNADNTSDSTKFAAAATLTNKIISAASNTISGLGTGNFAASVIDTDVNLAANSDTRLATQKAVKAYADALIAANDAMVLKGPINCSANPNYPAANAGHLYKVSAAGKVGGASGINVEVGDSIVCSVDGSAAGTHAAVGANWFVLQVNIDGAVIGPASSTNGNIATFSGTGGKTIQDSGKALPAGPLADTNSAQTFTNKTLTDAVANTQSAGNNTTKVANTAFVTQAVATAIAPTTSTITSAYTVAATDVGKLLKCSGTFAVSFPAAATCGNGFSVRFKNVGTGLVTLDPGGAETIDGLPVITLPPKAACTVVCDGSSFETIFPGQILLDSGTATSVSSLTLALPVGYGVIQIELTNVEPATLGGTAGAQILCQVSNDGGSTFKSGASDYRWLLNYVIDDGTEGGANSAADSKVLVSPPANTGGYGVPTQVEITDADINGIGKHLKFNSSSRRADTIPGRFQQSIGAGFYVGDTLPLTHVRFQMTLSVNFSKITWQVIGKRRIS